MILQRTRAGPRDRSWTLFKMTVRYLYLFGSVDHGGRGYCSEVCAVLMGPGSRTDRAFCVSSTLSWGAWTCLALGSTWCWRKISPNQALGGATGGMREVIGVTSLNKGRRWDAKGGVGGGGVGGKEMIAEETDATEQDLWRWISLPWSKLKSLCSD